jgi:DNA-binding NarL/FixJ family response regulator
MKKARKRYALIIADQRPIVQFGIKGLFQKSLPDMEVLTTDSGAGVLNHLRRNNVKAAILDICLIDGDIFQLLPQIWEISPDLPVLVYSSSSDDNDEEKLKQLGVRGYLNKQRSTEELESAIIDITQEEEASNPIDMVAGQEMELIKFLSRRIPLPELRRRMALTPSIFADFMGVKN